ncbi:MAG: hypothetical protein IPH14_02390 [Thermomonas sp.]|nr:hypothetical protein [Thermomonas sp.]
MNARLVSRRRAPARQQGVSLLVVLILMVVMSVLGIAVLRSSAMQERMSANMYDRSLATQAAEAALVEARAGLAVVPVSTGARSSRQTLPARARTSASAPPIRPRPQPSGELARL